MAWVGKVGFSPHGSPCPALSLSLSLSLSVSFFLSLALCVSLGCVVSELSAVVQCFAHAMLAGVSASVGS